jgi:hypothetical protein
VFDGKRAIAVCRQLQGLRIPAPVHFLRLRAGEILLGSCYGNLLSLLKWDAVEARGSFVLGAKRMATGPTAGKPPGALALKSEFLIDTLAIRNRAKLLKIRNWFLV